MTGAGALPVNRPKPIFFDDIALPPVSETASGRPWALRAANLRDVSTMVQLLDINPLLARVLSARGVAPDDAASYLAPKLRTSLPDPFVLKDMREAALRLAEAVTKNEKIGVFGDYDVDGVTAAALLYRYFGAIGVDIPVYLPDRITEGYGPTAGAFRSLMSDGAKIIVTVDCGASAHEAINEVAAEGAEFIVLDHHLMSGPPPAGALATVNPNRPDDVSGLQNLSAAGVAYVAAVALNRQLRELGFFKTRKEPNLLHLLDLAALGLVCDVMEMQGITRVLVSQGLKILDAGENIGLAALAKQAGAKPPASPYHFGFLLGPRINAAGRIGHARLAFELLTTSDPQRAQQLAEKLHVMNAERQAIEATVQTEALRLIERENLNEKEVIVAAGEGWHPGVIGIVAGRIKEKFEKPAIVIGVENGVGKGSGRSIAGVDLGSAIASARKEGMLIAGGGHAMAAGLTIDENAISEFRTYLDAQLADDIQHARASRKFEIDAVAGANMVSRTFAEIVSTAGPYGVGNPEPVFALCDVGVVGTKVVGGDHIAVTLKDRTGAEVRAIAFRAEGERLGDTLRGAKRLHVAGKIRADAWRGGDAGQLQIEDAAPVAR